MSLFVYSHAIYQYIPHCTNVFMCTEQRIERLRGASDGRRDARDDERHHIDHLPRRVVARGRLVQQIAVLELLGHPLDHRERLAELGLQNTRQSTAHKICTVLYKTLEMSLELSLDTRERLTEGDGPEWAFG